MEKGSGDLTSRKLHDDTDINDRRNAVNVLNNIVHLNTETMIRASMQNRKRVTNNDGCSECVNDILASILIASSPAVCYCFTPKKLLN